jgi:Cytochrome P460
MFFKIYALICCFLIAGCASDVSPRQPGVTFPPNYPQDFVQYARVDRTDGKIRDLFINRAAFEAFQSGYPLPNDTIILIDGYDASRDADGKLILDEQGRYIKDKSFENFHVAHKRSDWTDADFLSSIRVGQWNFGSFNPDGTAFDEDLNACFNCHQVQVNTDFIYSYRQLARFSSSDQIQYFLCNLSERIACPEETGF